MTTFQERDKWEEVNQLMEPERWKINSAWLQEFTLNPSAFPIFLSKYKFAAKMFPKDQDVLEIGYRHGMGVQILAEFCKSYTGIEDASEMTEKLEENLEGSKYQFLNFSQFKEKQEDLEFDNLALINSDRELIENYLFDAIDRNLKEDGKAICGIEAKTTEDLKFSKNLKAQLLERFKRVVPFYLNSEIVQCGDCNHPAHILYLCMQKKR